MSIETEIKTIADITRMHAKRRPQALAMVFEGRETTFAELDRRACQVANGFIEEGLAPQSRIAVLDKNSDNYFEILFGAAKANHVLVAVNWRLAPPEIAYVINDATAEILFVGKDYFDTVEKIRGELVTVKKIIALGEGVTPSIKCIHSAPHPEWESYTDWRDRQSESEPDIANAGSDVVLQMYTSGTTGHPKGAQLTNDNFPSLIPPAVKEMGEWTEGDVSLIAMPVFHIGGTGWGMLGFYVGANNVLLRDVIPSEILRLISERRVTKTFFVPAVLLFLLQTPGVEETDFSSLKLIVYGASPMPLDLLRRSVDRFKCDFAQVYGMTETTGAFTWLPPEDHDLSDSERMLSCGKPFSFAKVRVVDAEGRDMPPGEVGEIVCCSPQNMKGYWNLPEETAATIRGEWLHTGDAGYMDADGYTARGVKRKFFQEERIFGVRRPWRRFGCIRS
ncbi:MAG: AMP-binding protein [Blastocatellia bacterium]|nr:AMP-binding protein [Blastocatellia bacterium]